MTTSTASPKITRYLDGAWGLGFTCSCGVDTDSLQPAELEQAIREHLAEVHGLTCDASPSGRHGRGPRCGFCDEVLWGPED